MPFTPETETQVNTHTAGAQNYQRILTLADGGWVVVWNSVGQDGDWHGVYQQRYDADGVAVGKEERVNSHTTNSQSLTTTGSGQFNTQTIALSNGGWVVSWTSWDQDGEYAGVYQQAYRADGTRLGGERQVNIATDLGQQDPVLAPLANGGWVVYWISQEEDGTPFGAHRLYHRSYNASGTPTSGEIRIDPIHETDLGEAQLRVAALDGGGWVATWVNVYQYPNADNDVYYEAYNAAGSRIGSGRVNTATEGNQGGNAVAGLDGGGWVIIWNDGVNLLQRVYKAGQGGGVQTVFSEAHSNARITALDGGGWVVVWETGAYQSPSLHQRAYDAAGKSLGAAEAIFSSGTPAFHQTVALKGGGWVVAWTHKGTENDIAAQIYNADGSKDGNPIFLNSTRAGAQYWVKLAALEDGGFVATWTSDGQDGSEAGVFQRIFRPEGAQNAAPVAQDDSAAVDLFGKVRGNVISDAAGADSDADGDALSVTGLEGGAPGKALAGRHGTLLLKADGSYVYTADLAAPLAVGRTVTDRFVYTVSDGNGGSDEAVLTVRVTGVARGTAGADHLLGTGKADSLYGRAGNDRLEGVGGNDRLSGEAGADTLLGGKGDDTLIGGAGGDRLEGGAGSDTASYQGAAKAVTASLADPSRNRGDAAGDSYVSIENLTGSARADDLGGDGKANRLDGLAGADTLEGGKGKDSLDGGDGADSLSGGAGNDVLAGGKGRDMLAGGTEHDRLDGGAGDDRLGGGAGRDTLTGGAGDDILTGGAGKDSFVFGQRGFGQDRITDFRPGSGDLVVLDHTLLADFAAVRAAAVQRGAHTVIDLGQGDRIVLEEVALSDLRARDFDFL